MWPTRKLVSQDRENQLRAQPKQADQSERLPAISAREHQADVVKGNLVRFFLLILSGTSSWQRSSSRRSSRPDRQVKFKTLLALVSIQSARHFESDPAIVSLLGSSAMPSHFQIPSHHPGYFVDPATNPVLYSFLSSFDVFPLDYDLGRDRDTCISKVKTNTALSVVFGWFPSSCYWVGATAAFS